MQTINSLEDIQRKSDLPGMSLFYFSRSACGVCTAIKPKVLIMLEDFPEISSYYINLDDVPEAAGQLSLFTIPAVLVFTDGKELVREARYISIPDLADKVRRPYEFIYKEDN